MIFSVILKIIIDGLLQRQNPQPSEVMVQCLGEVGVAPLRNPRRGDAAEHPGCSADANVSKYPNGI